MNRIDFQQLADDRVTDANALLDAGRWSGAYYLAGYAVECALKACIAKQTNRHDFPEKSFVQKAFTHDLSELVELAGLRIQLKLDTLAIVNPVLSKSWQTAKDWNERSRYQQKTEDQARKLFNAVTDPTNGVLPWIKVRW